MGKRDSRRHSATSFSKNVMLVRHKLLSIIGFTILWLGDNLTYFNKDNSANFFGQKDVQEAVQGVYYLRKRKKTLSLNLVLVVFLVLESKVL